MSINKSRSIISVPGDKRIFITDDIATVRWGERYSAKHTRTTHQTLSTHKGTLKDVSRDSWASDRQPSQFEMTLYALQQAVHQLPWWTLWTSRSVGLKDINSRPDPAVTGWIKNVHVTLEAEWVLNNKPLVRVVSKTQSVWMLHQMVSPNTDLMQAVRLKLHLRIYAFVAGCRQITSHRCFRTDEQRSICKPFRIVKRGLAKRKLLNWWMLFCWLGNI